MNMKYAIFQINAPALQNALSPDTKPWIDLGRNLGIAAAALGNNSKQGITVTAYGKLLVKCYEYIRCVMTKHVIMASNQIQHKGSCTATEDG